MLSHINLYTVFYTYFNRELLQLCCYEYGTFQVCLQEVITTSQQCLMLRRHDQYGNNKVMSLERYLVCRCNEYGPVQIRRHNACVNWDCTIVL